MTEIVSGARVGRRVVVTGLGGAGKSTFSRALAVKTGLPVLHLDLGLGRNLNWFFSNA